MKKISCFSEFFTLGTKKDNNENLNFRQRIFLFQNHITENYFTPLKVQGLFQLNDLDIFLKQFIPVSKYQEGARIKIVDYVPCGAVAK